MRTIIRTTHLLALCLLTVTLTHSQDTRTFNQNASRSNHTRFTSSDGWTFGVNTGASFGLDSKENSLFRGNSFASKMMGRYYFGNIGLGLTSGIAPGTINDNALSSFITQRKFPRDQVQITKSNPFNSYLLFGPSFRFGSRVMINADIQGGVFFNNPGAVNIAQLGATRSLYRFDGGNKNIYPGVSGSISVAYPINKTTHFFINTDYLQSKNSIRLLDPSNGIDVATIQNRDLKLMTAGVGIIKSFGGMREKGSGMATGRRHIGQVKYQDIKLRREGNNGPQTGRVLPTVNKREIAIDESGVHLSTDGDNNGIQSPRDAQSGMATGRVLPTVNKREIAIDEPGVQRMADGGCGPVTQRTTNPDGTTDEMVFSCPSDAVDYNNRISMNVTTGKQTQGATFGEKVNAGLHAAGSALANGASREGVIHRDLGDRNIISGRLSWSNPDNNPAYAIVTNTTTRGGSATLNSQTSATRQTNQSSFGTLVKNGAAGFTTAIYAREAGSGMATGKRSAREAGSGMATGRRQYAPVFSENENDPCENCTVSVKLTAHELTHVVQQSAGSVKNRTAANNDNDCDGISGIDVYLLDPASHATIAKTVTEACGNFWFANVPAGDYIVKLSGDVVVKKQYDIAIADSKQDIAGNILRASGSWALQLNTSSDEEAKASINTTRSNIKRLVLINSDTDENGSYDSFRAIATYSDGSSNDITSSAAAVAGGKKVTLSSGGGAAAASYAATGRTAKLAANLVGINLADQLRVTATFSDGTTKDVTDDAKVSHHPNVVQVYLDLADTDGDGMADAVIKTKTKSNQSNDRYANNNDGNDEIWSPRSNMKILPVVAGGADMNGATVVGGLVPGGAEASSARVAGSPIGGIVVKGGKNPGGGSSFTTTTNEYGEFELAAMEPGNYFINVEHHFIVADETPVSTGDDGISSRKGWDGTVKGGSKIQDQPSLSSNKSGNADNPAQQQRKLKGKVIKTGDSGMLLAEANELITFSWTPVKTTGQPVYKLRVWQLMQGQNGTAAMRSNQPLVEKTITGSAEATVDNILTGPCKPPYLCDFIWSAQLISSNGNAEGKSQEGSFSTGQQKAQNNNTVRSNRTELKSILIEADLDGDGEYETDVTNKLTDEITLDENGNLSGVQPKTGSSKAKTAVSTRSSLQRVDDGLYVSYGTALINGKETEVKSVLKTKHDTAKNSVGNIR